MGVVDEMHPTWQHSSAGKLAMQEFPYQRMHRDPVPPPRPLDMSDQFETSYRRQFKQAVPQPARAVPQFSLGRKNALGTSSTYQKMTMDEFKVSKLGLGDSARSWSTNFGDAFSAPDLSHPRQGINAPRGGLAPRMPFSEVERRFGSLDSEGTMPGKEGKLDGVTEHNSSFADPGKPQGPREKASLTLGYSNDIGTCVKYQKTPALLADLTHYSLGDVPKSFVTSTGAAMQPPPSHAERTRQPAAGHAAPIGPSEVEQRFRQQWNSRHYNILNNGGRLLGEQNSDALLAARNRAAFERPVGRKQHPCVNPADRGVTGMRQAYDIITGADRPRERW